MKEEIFNFCPHKKLLKSYDGIIAKNEANEKGIDFWKLDFQKSLGVAASTFVAVIQSKHGSKLIEKDKEITVTNKVLFENAAFRILGRAIQTCPDNVPKKSKQEFDNAIKQLQNSKNN